MTNNVNERLALDTSFAKFVTNAIARFLRHDWGELCEEDTKANDWAIDNDARVLAAYGTQDDKIWIIQEWDRSVTTVLFPSEY
jgi:hypothetical protein